MGDKFFPKFNLYDQIGYLLVGSIALIVFIFDLYLLDKRFMFPKLTTSNFIVWLIIAYFLGHIFQAIANVFIKEDKNNFSDSEKEILNRAKEYFKAEKQSLHELYSLCYMISSAKDITGQIQSFNAYYSLYRGWSIIFTLESSFLLILMVMNWFNIKNFILFILSLMITILFIRRMRRFYNYSRSKTLQTFLILSKNIFQL